MASNFFGQIFRITTFGESHGTAIGVVIDGCPAGLSITQEEIQTELNLRKPGNSPFTSPRKESDQVEILSGIFENKTTGTPIALLIRNRDIDSSSYDVLKDLYRPGHANFTYLKKYGIFDYRGGGRSSARETAARVAAGAIAKKLLRVFGVECVSFLHELGGIGIELPELVDLQTLHSNTYSSPIFCPDPIAAKSMIKKLEEIKQAGDSLGGIIGCTARLPIGLGEPIYYKLEGMLASAMLSLPASKGFEIGAGFNSARMKGSEHNDQFDVDEAGEIYLSTNSAGGTLGGISNGAPLFFRVAFKPTSSIKHAQNTIRLNGKKETIQLPETARHDPCVAIRAVPVVEAMTALVLADALLLGQNSSLIQNEFKNR